MMKRLALLSTVAALSIGGAAWAQENQPQAPAEQVIPPAEAPANQPADPATTDPATGGAIQQDVPSTGAVGEITTEPPATPPPAEAVIPAQAADEVRADTLIGMDVYNPEGDKVGKVKDILLDESGQVKGVVLSVGGVLGLGAKSVGLNWSEVDVQPDNEMVKIQYTKEQLEAAPDFKTQETQRAESEATMAQPPSATGTVPPAEPATTE
jgi:sporulation protein YlmC with PRC-barrel domain